MDIKPPLDGTLQLAIAKSGGTVISEFKLNQILDAKIITTQEILNTLTVSIADKTLALQSRQALPLQPGQTLQLQVVKLLPTPEFKILASPLPPSLTAAPAKSGEPPVLKLLPTPPSSIPPAPSRPDVPLAALTVGRQLAAQVLSIGKQTMTLQLVTDASLGNPNSNTANASPPNAQIMLDAKQLLWQGSSGKPALAAGDHIDLVVVKEGNKPLFSASQAPPAALVEDQIVSAFKQLLPQQNSAAQFLGQLGRLLPELGNDKNVGETLKLLALKILQAIPDKNRLFEPVALKQAIARSGLFMEHYLADAATAGSQSMDLQDDFKLKLSKLIAQLGLQLAAPNDEEAAQPAHNELLKETLQKAQGNLARLTLDQLHSLPHDDSPKQVWILELPFFNKTTPDTLQLIVEQDKQGDSETGQKNWVVSVTITPPELATIHCKISCYDGSVNTRFWSESSSTVEKINARLDYLKQQFEQKGLKPGFMDVQQGKPAQANPQILPPQNLVSEKV